MATGLRSVRGEARCRLAAGSAAAKLVRFPAPPAPFALSAEARDYAARIELIAAGRPLVALDAMLRHLQRRSA